jgi:hypothetical protein
VTMLVKEGRLGQAFLFFLAMIHTIISLMMRGRRGPCRTP